MPTLDAPLAGAPTLAPTIDTRPRATEEWLARLPFADPIETAQQLGLALARLNRVTLDEDRRLALLALYRPVVARAAASLEALLLDAGVPPSAQQRRAGSLLRQLCVEFATSWKRALNALSGRRSGRCQIRHIAEVTANRLDALFSVQFSCHLSYSPAPDRFWLELHDTYALARSNGLSAKTVHEARAADAVYVNALLLELADPPHMSRAELTHLKLYLQRFGAFATLKAAPPSDGRSHGFAIDTHADQGPGHASAPAGPVLWLDTEAICRHAHEVGVRLRTGETPRQIGLPGGMHSEASLALARHLAKLWRPGNHRAFKRYPASAQSIAVVAGVGAIHDLLGVAGAGDDGLVTTWTPSNDSAAGLALHGAPELPLNLRIGDALALRGAPDVAWSLGVIRWIKMLDARTVELGIERLAPTIEPVRVRPLKGRRRASAEAALFVPGSPALKQPDRLLLPSHVYQKGRQAEVRRGGASFVVSLDHRADRTPSFDLIDFTVWTDTPLS